MSRCRLDPASSFPPVMTPRNATVLRYSRLPRGPLLLSTALPRVAIMGPRIGNAFSVIEPRRQALCDRDSPRVRATRCNALTEFFRSSVTATSRPLCEMSGRNTELVAKTYQCLLDVATLFNRHSTMKRRQTLRMPVPLSRPESAIVLKSGAKRPVAGDVSRCARLRRSCSACPLLRVVVRLLMAWRAPMPLRGNS